MALVSDSQLTALRGIAALGLTSPFEVYRPTKVETDAGMKQTFALVSSGDGWLRMMNQPHIGQSERNSVAMNRYRLHTPIGTDIDVGDEVRMFGNEKYFVQDVNEDDTVQIFRTAILRRVA